MKKLIAIASAAALGLGVAACDSGAENAAEDQVEATADLQEAEIDMAEETGQITDDQADAAEDAVDAQEDAALDAADEIN